MEEKDFVTLAVHNEFARRIDDENHRQNRRIEALEGTVHQISELTTSVKELAVNMGNMVKEQEKQGKRLEALEGRDGEMWRKVVAYIVTAVVGIVLGFLFTKIGL